MFVQLVVLSGVEIKNLPIYGVVFSGLILIIQLSSLIKKILIYIFYSTIASTKGIASDRGFLPTS